MKNGKLHVGLMVLICLVPVLIVLALPALGINMGGGAWILMILLCPLAHLLMMRYMHGPGRTEGHTHEPRASQSVQEVGSGEGSSVTTGGDARPLPPVPAINKLPVPVSNRRPDRSSAD
jgi:hypothetical protein